MRDGTGPQELCMPETNQHTTDETRPCSGGPGLHPSFLTYGDGRRGEIVHPRSGREGRPRTTQWYRWSLRSHGVVCYRVARLHTPTTSPKPGRSPGSQLEVYDLFPSLSYLPTKFLGRPQKLSVSLRQLPPSRPIETRSVGEGRGRVKTKFDFEGGACNWETILFRFV